MYSPLPWSNQIGAIFAPLLVLAAFSPSIIAQSPIYPIAQLDVGDHIELQVVDRFLIPVKDAAVAVVTSQYGITMPFVGKYSFGTSRLDGLSTDENGIVRIPASRSSPFLATVTKGGYAICSAYWLWPGWKYRAVLHIGSVASFQCVDLDGRPVGDVPLRLWSQDCSGMPAYKHSQDFLRTDADGRVEAYFLRNGQYSAVAGDARTGMGVIQFQVCNQYGHEEPPSLSKLTITLQDPVGASFTVVDTEGNAVPGLITNYFSPLGDVDPWVKVFCDGNSVSFGPAPLVRSADHHVKFGAPGYIPQMWSSRNYRTNEGGANTPIVLKREDCENIQIQIPQELHPCRVFVPEVIRMLSNWREILPSESGIALIEKVPASCVVFGVVERNNQVLGFLARSGTSGTPRVVLIGNLMLQYDVNGVPPSLISDAKWTNHPSDVARNLWGLWERYVVSDPQGRVRIDGIYPGRYSLDPHMHGTVYEDVLSEYGVQEGVTVTDAIHVRPGLNLSGYVLAKDTRRPILRGYVTCSSTSRDLHFPISQLDSSGHFIISGLPEGEDYSITYHAAPWFCLFHKPKAQSSDDEFHVVADNIRVPQAEKLEIAVPERFAQPR